MVSFHIETVNSGANQPLQISFIKIDVSIVRFRNLLKMAVLKEVKVLSYVLIYT